MTEAAPDRGRGIGARVARVWRGLARRTRTQRAIEAVVSATLIGAAVWMVMGRSGELSSAAAEVRSAPVWAMALCAMLPVLNWVMVSASLTTLTRLYGRVGYGEMVALVGSAWLLNYLPLRPGMVGRIAYHRVVNGLRVGDAVRVLVLGTGMTACACVLICALALAGRGGVVVESVVLGVPMVVMPLAMLVRKLHGERGRLLVASAMLRYADVLVWSARYALVFWLIGHPLTVAQAVGLAGVSQFVLLVPFAGNGLGLREWAIAATATAAGVSGASGALAGAEQALAADLIHRAVEMAVAVPVGLACSVWVYRRWRRYRRSRAAQAPSPDA